MILSFLNADLEELCNNQRLQDKRLGAAARRLRARLADLAAAARVSDLVAGRPHPLRGDREGQLALTLDGGRRLVLEPAHDPVPALPDGGVDWSQVTAVRIVFVGDYHD